MLGAKEIALRRDLKEFRKEINKMIKELDKALTPGSGLLESKVVQKQCLARLRELRKKIDETIKKQEYPIWIR